MQVLCHLSYTPETSGDASSLSADPRAVDHHELAGSRGHMLPWTGPAGAEL